MNKKLLSAFFGCLLPATFSVPAAAADSGLYVAADLGQSHYSGGVFDDPYLPRSEITSDKDTVTANRYTAGYQITPYWGVELGYVNLGQGTVSFASPSPAVSSSTGANLVSAEGPFIAGTGTWPINAHWSLYARAGLISSELDYQNLCNNGSCGLFGNQTYTESEATYGVGVKWNFSPQWSLRLGWDHYGHLGQSYTANLLTLGVEWHIPEEDIE